MMGYYSKYPAIAQQTLATLFPFLEDIKDHLTKTDPASPFSGAARGPAQTPATRPGKKRNKQDKKHGPKPTQQSSGTTRWGPKGAVLLATKAPPAIDPRDAKLAALEAQVAAMMAAPAYGENFGMPVYPPAHTHATLASSSRPRAHYCWLHGWNNSHEGHVCKVMTNDAQYTSAMRNATSEIGSGGNPKIGVPVTYTRPQFVFSRKASVCFSLSSHPLCTPCALTTPPSRASRDKPATTPNEDIRVSDAKNKHSSQQTPTSEGLTASRVRDMAFTPLINPFKLPLSEPFPPDHSHTTLWPSPFSLPLPHNHPHPPLPPIPHPPLPPNHTTTSVSWSSPPVTLSISIPARPSHLQQDTTATKQHQHLVRTQDRTRPVPSPSSLSSRFSHVNAFSCLSDPDSDSESDTDADFPPHLPTVSHLHHAPPLLPSKTTPAPTPLIADTGCTGVLLQQCNFPSLSLFFTPKPLPCIPFTLPDRSILSVGGPSHITGELTLPHKKSPISCYFLPDSSLSHSLVGISTLLRPHGHAVFNSTSVFLFDTPTSPLPFLTGKKHLSSEVAKGKAPRALSWSCDRDCFAQAPT